MKKGIFISLALTSLFSLSFLTNPNTPIELKGSKWISPITDNCFESLCFTSKSTAVYYNCGPDLYMEIGYSINGNTIEINAFSDSSMDSASKLTLFEDKGILRQSPGQTNTFPKNFIKVPSGVCN